MGIAHRKLTLDSIRMRRKGDKAIAIIDGMDLAIQLAPAQQAIQSFGLDLAPEIEAGEPHDKSADIWALGRMGQQLLAYMQSSGKANQNTSKLEALFTLMVSRDPAQRHTIDGFIANIQQSLTSSL